MDKYKYLIVGGGMAADAAARAIHERDPQGSLAIFGRELDPPYTRPNLSKGLWKGKSVEKIFRHTQDTGAQLHLGRIITELDLDDKKVRDDEGNWHGFDKLLIATGGTPRELPFDVEGINYYRNLSDYRHLRAATENNDNFGVIGGGFIGSEISAALTMNGKKVTMLFPEDGISARLFPADLSHFLNDYYRQKGVEVLTGQTVNGLSKEGGKYQISTKSGKVVEVGGVVAGLGILLNIDLAKNAGLKMDRAIEVDQHLRTSHPDVYAAGDVATFYNHALSKWMTVEHEDNALTMGQMAGANMAGDSQIYEHLPYFYSDLFDLGYEAVGEFNPQGEVISDWKDPFQQGVVYYLREGRVRGVLLWNVWKMVPTARELIAAKGPFTKKDLIGRIPFDS